MICGYFLNDLNLLYIVVVLDEKGSPVCKIALTKWAFTRVLVYDFKPSKMDF